MDQYQDQHVIFQELLTSSLEKIKTLLPKKYVDLKLLIEKSLDQIKEIKNDKSRFDVKANKYFVIYKLGLETKQSKVIECCLYDIDKLVSHGFLDGVSYDYAEAVFLDESTKSKKYKKHQRMLIDTIVESVCACQSESDEILQLQLLKVLQSLLLSPRCRIHHETLLLAINTVFNIYESIFASQKDCKSASIGTAARGTLSRTIDHVFLKVEALLSDSGPEMDNLTKKTRYLNEQQNSLQLRKQEEKALKISTQANLSKEEAYSIIQTYNKKVVQHVVDDVCLYLAKIQTNAEQDVPLRSVPLINESEDPKYKTPIAVQINNESEVKSGKFGWCIMCRNTAQFFCKDTRVPICSVDCKKKHFDESQFAQQACEIYSEKQSEQPCFKDAKLILKSFCSLSLDDTQPRERVLALELIHHIIGNFKECFVRKLDFINLIRDDMMEPILQNALDSEKAIYMLAYGIFVQLVFYFRDLLRPQIEALVNHIFLKILGSQQIPLQQKQFAFKVFESILHHPAVATELFLNHDCIHGHMNMMQQIIECVAKVSQGRYGEQPQEIEPLKLGGLVMIRTFLEKLIAFTEQLNREHIESSSPERIENAQTDVKELMKRIESYDTLEKQKNHKHKLSEIVNKFNNNPDDAYSQLVRQGIIQNDDAKAFAKFMREQTGLSKATIGEYFGSPREFPQSVLFEYTAALDFRKMSYLDALREYLDQFNLPIESQQIDRVMQVFANKYQSDNSQSFKSGDAAYTFSYLVMMLQTDRYNPNVKDKMTLASFSKLAKGINDGEDLPDETLLNVYQSIQERPLGIHESFYKQVLSQIVRGNFKYRLDEFKRETEKLIRKSSNHEYMFAENCDQIKLLIQNNWGSLFATLSLILQTPESSDNEIDCSVDSVQFMIILLGMLDLNQERETYLSLLSQFCAINQIGMMKFKNFKALQSLMGLAQSHGNYLRSNWRPILDFISQLEIYTIKYRTVGEKLHDLRQIQLIVNQSYTDKLMSNSVFLDARSIIEFIRCMIEISELELADQENPRVSSLQRLVEVASCNMDRIRLTWKKIWDMMRDHFIKVGRSQNVQVSLYAIDQLKQLSIKFLEKTELAQFHYQYDFLIPFETIFQEVQNLEIRLFILHCLTMLTNCCFFNIKSGWRVIFQILNLALSEDQLALTVVVVQVLDKIFSETLESVFDIFSELQLIIEKLFKQSDSQMIMKSISYLTGMVDYLLDKSEQVFEEYWFKSVANLSILFRDQNFDIRIQAIKAFFDLLHKCSQNLRSNPMIWSQIVKGIMKDLFLAVKDAIQTSNLDSLEQARGICRTSIECFEKFILQKQGEQAFVDGLGVLVNNTCSNCDHLSSLSFQALRRLIQKALHSLNQEQLTSITQLLKQIHIQCSPHEILDAYTVDFIFQRKFEEMYVQDFKIVDTHYEFDSKLSVHQCMVQLMLIDLLFDLTPVCNEQHISEILSILDQSYEQASTFNKNIYLRLYLQRNGYLVSDRQNQLPGLLKQERTAIQTILNVLQFQIQKTNKQEYKMEYIKRGVLLIQRSGSSIDFSAMKPSKTIQSLRLNTIGLLEWDKLQINTLTIVADQVLPMLCSLNLDDLMPSKEQLIKGLLNLPQCHSIMSLQCPHCVQCPYQCSFKPEWKNLTKYVKILLERMIFGQDSNQGQS